MDKEWRQIPGYPGYVMNIHGIVVREKWACRIIQHQWRENGIHVHMVNDDGYRKLVPIAPILLELFGVEEKPKSRYRLTCGFKDKNRFNFSLDNLKWVCLGWDYHG